MALHRLALIHGRLCTPTILVTGDDHVVLSDYAMTGRRWQGGLSTPGDVGMDLCLPPEYWSDNKR